MYTVKLWYLEYHDTVDPWISQIYLIFMLNLRQQGLTVHVYAIQQFLFCITQVYLCIKQMEMIKCLEFGLVSKCAKTCTNSLRICTLEMQEVMMRLLPSVLLQLSRISATVHMAIPVLAFLSSKGDSINTADINRQYNHYRKF